MATRSVIKRQELDAHGVVGAGLVIRGDVLGQGSVSVQGRVEGNIEVDDTVIVADGASVEGDLSGRRLIVQGSVHGDLQATEGVVLAAGSVVRGVLHTNELAVEEGADFSGTVDMSVDLPDDVRPRERD